MEEDEDVVMKRVGYLVIGATERLKFSLASNWSTKFHLLDEMFLVPGWESAVQQMVGGMK